MMRYDRLLQIITDSCFFAVINGKGNTAVEIWLTYLRRLSSKFALPVVIFIFHKMNEVMEHTDRITVLKKGRVADEMLAEDATIDRRTKAAVGGRDMDQIVRTRQKGKGELMLEAKELRVKNGKGLITLHNIIFISNVRGYLYR